MIEEQVDEEIFAVDHDPLLPGDEGEARAEFEDKPLHLPEDRRLQIFLAITRISAGREIINLFDGSAPGFQGKAASPAPNR